MILMPDAAITPTPHVGSLFVFLNNLCNMACPNCFTPLSHSGVAPLRLAWEDLAGALDLYAALPDGPRKNIVIIGGEPLLSFDLLLRALDRLDRASNPPRVEIFTNGALLDAEKYKRMRRDYLKLYVSLDGDRKGNDAYRVFVNSSDSVYDSVMRRLEGLPLQEMGVFVVMHPENLEGLSGAVREFAGMGFGAIDFCIDMIEEWSPEGIKGVRKFTREFALFFEEHTRREGKIPFTCEMIEQALLVGNSLAEGLRWWEESAELILGADGRYYPCEGATHFPYAAIREPLSLGEARNGEPDWERRKRFLDEADAFLRAADTRGRWQILSPRIFYTKSLITKRDARKHLETFHRFSEAFLVELLRAASRLQDHPVFRERYLDRPA